MLSGEPLPVAVVDTYLSAIKPASAVALFRAKAARNSRFSRSQAATPAPTSMERS
jgi:hypothetical protein